MKEYSFYVAVYPNGRQLPTINFHSESLYNLNGFAKEILSTNEILDNIIDNINQVINGEIENFSFGEDERNNFLVKKEKTEVYNSFDEYEPFFIDSKLIYEVLLDWKDFVQIWKNNKIPNLIYSNK